MKRNPNLCRTFCRILPLFCIMALMTVSCGPTTFYILDVETSRPSVSGVDLVGKSVSVVYVNGGDRADSLFSAELSSAFVSTLESDYFGGDSLVTMFCLDRRPDADYSDKRQMIDLLVETDSDVLFVFDTPSFSAGTTSVHVEADSSMTAVGSFPFSVDLYVYDSMDKRDTVRHFSGTSVAEVSASVSGTESQDGISYLLRSNLGDAARTVGKTSGGKFAPGWKAEEIFFYLYGSQEWYNTYYYVNGYRWQKAMDIWMSMLDTPNMEKKACLEYNLAAACYILGEYQLASDWLEMSENDFQLHFAPALRQKIESRLK